MKHHIRRAAALMLSLLLVLTTFALPMLTAGAASEHIEVYMIGYPRGVSNPLWGQRAVTLMNGWHLDETSFYTVKRAENKGMEVVYCVRANRF